ncbi:MAG: IS1595 family transposase, partial [Flavobacteriia bacterium]|nr:IS1595 family transposase [Flavobacteriia bacterium]
YCFRFNRSFMHEGAFQNLLDRMVASPPRPYNTILA